MKKFQVVIVGGGPAGAACAQRLVQAGVNCLVVDSQGFPRPKTCAGWITPAVFEDLGISPGDYPFDLSIYPGLRIYFKGFPVTRPGTQYAIRRLEFDSWLLDVSGAEFLEHEVKDIQRVEGGYRLDGILEAETLVGAGGTHCPVYRTFYAERLPRKGARIVALESEYQANWDDSDCRLWFFENRLPGYAWYVPKKGGYLNIGVGGNVAVLKERGSTIQDQWEYLVEKLERLDLIDEAPEDPRGYVYYLNNKHEAAGYENPYLVGDAAGLATLDMGEGIGPAIRSGQLAAEAILTQGAFSLEGIRRYSLLPAGLRWLL